MKQCLGFFERPESEISRFLDIFFNFIEKLLDRIVVRWNLLVIIIIFIIKFIFIIMVLILLQKKPILINSFFLFTLGMFGYF